MALETDKLRAMSSEELERQARQLREEIWKLRLQMATGQLQQPQRVRQVRKDLARVLTVARERQLAEAGSPGRARRRRG